MYYPEPQYCEPYCEFGRYGLDQAGCFDINSLEPSFDVAATAAAASAAALSIPIRSSPSSGEEFDDPGHYYAVPPGHYHHRLASNVDSAAAEEELRRRGQKIVKKRRPKKDPNEPHKPVSAYALFFRDTQATIKGQNPNASFGQVSKIVAAMWDALDADAKTNYKQRTETAKKDYLKQLAAYRANQISQNGGFGFMDLLEHGDSRSPASAAPLAAAVIDASKSDADRELGTRTLASLIAQPTAQGLTATTTLTLRTKPDFEADDWFHHGPPVQCRGGNPIIQHFYAPPPPANGAPHIIPYQSV